MNERIRQLALQAGALLSPGYNVEYTVKHVDSDVLDKFAELIIRECAGIVGTDMGDIVKKHFGVER
jgi:hypothetical protein